MWEGRKWTGKEVFVFFVVFRFRGQSVSRAVSHEGGDETSASLFFRENGLDAILARARFLSRGWQTGRERRGDVLADRRVSFRASSAVPTPRGDRVSSRTFMMVAPSFEMVVTPLSSCTSLSKPRGPCAIGGHRGQRKYEIERAPSLWRADLRRERPPR
jgi:hypothetical protein